MPSTSDSKQPLFDLTEDQSRTVARDETQGTAVRDELADAFIYLLHLGIVSKLLLQVELDPMALRDG